VEWEALLDRILENTPPLEPLRVEHELNHKEVSSAKAKPIAPLERPSPEPKDLEEGFQPSDLSYFVDDFLKISEIPQIMPKEATSLCHSLQSLGQRTS
jgi:hypothetical protein